MVDSTGFWQSCGGQSARWQPFMATNRQRQLAIREDAGVCSLFIVFCVSAHVSACVLPDHVSACVCVSVIIHLSYFVCISACLSFMPMCLCLCTNVFLPMFVCVSMPVLFLFERIFSQSVTAFCLAASACVSVSVSGSFLIQDRWLD